MAVKKIKGKTSFESLLLAFSAALVLLVVAYFLFFGKIGLPAYLFSSNVLLAIFLFVAVCVLYYFWLTFLARREALKVFKKQKKRR